MRFFPSLKAGLMTTYVVTGSAALGFIQGASVFEGEYNEAFMNSFYGQKPIPGRLEFGCKFLISCAAHHALMSTALMTYPLYMVGKAIFDGLSNPSDSSVSALKK